MINIVLGVAVILILAIVAIIFRIQKLVSSVKSTEDNRGGTSNKANAIMMMVFLIGGLALFIWSYFKSRDGFIPEAASIHGLKTDELFWVTMAIITIVFIATHILLFYFPYRYQFKATRKAHFFPDNHKLELLWTVIPAIVLSLLVFSGWKVWRDITAQAPENAEVVEVVGMQFQWLLRYPGKNDSQLGEYNYKLIDATNELGIDLTDQASFDDMTPKELHIPKGRPVVFKIRARDVLHSVSAPHFRLKMDAVPGMPTKFWFVPTKSTADMRSELNNPDFNFELACQEVCGRGHFAMRTIIVVDEEDAYKKWYTEQKSWLANNPDYLEKVPANLKEKAIRSMNLTPEETAALLEKVKAESGSTAVNASASLK